MLKDAVLILIGLVGGLFIQQSVEKVLAAAPLWLSVPISIGGVGGFILLFVSGARRVMNGHVALPVEPGEDED